MARSTDFPELNWTTNWKLFLQKLHSSWCVTQQTWGKTSKTFFWIPISQTNNQGLTSIFRRLLEISLICNNDLLVAIECFFVITELQGCSLLHVKWLVQSRQEWGPETYWNSILQKLKSFLKPVCWIAKHIKQRVDNNAQPSQHIGWNVRLLKTCLDGCKIKKELMLMCNRVVCTLLSLLA